MRTRWFPENLDKVIEKKDFGIECRYSEKDNEAILYVGDRSKREWYVRFQSQQKMMEYIEYSINEYLEKKYRKMAQKDASKRNTESANINKYFTIGDIYYTSGGWEQTNVHFYQVVRLTKHTVCFKEIRAQSVRETSSMSDEVVAMPNVFIEGKEYGCRFSLDSRGMEYLSPISKYEHLYKWDGAALHRSWWA